MVDKKAYPDNPQSRSVGVIAIGRNEGPRIEACVRSASAQAAVVVYVDSGSTDDSVKLAENAGALSLALDMRLPFTAARARNAGYRRLRELLPNPSYVQFVDGDCELNGDWISQGITFLDRNPDVAVVCGRRQERFPSKSIYNELCDIEWDTPIGEALACGGDALMRVKAFDQVMGYREELIAGEEPELCLRLRQKGWKIWRLDAEMTYHDAAILRLGQWWRRHIRSGYAFAEGAYLHGRTPERHWVWETIRALFWGAALPIVGLLSIAAFGPWGVLLMMIYPVQFIKRLLRTSGPLPSRARLSFFELFTRFPEALGALEFLRNLLLGRRGHLIEYK
jgi:GT2 family glycosyltransferase